MASSPAVATETRTLSENSSSNPLGVLEASVATKKSEVSKPKFSGRIACSGESCVISTGRRLLTAGVLWGRADVSYFREGGCTVRGFVSTLGTKGGQVFENASGERAAWVTPAFLLMWTSTLDHHIGVF